MEPVAKETALSPAGNDMARLTTNLQGKQHAEEALTGKALPTDYARGARNGNKQGQASPKQSRLVTIVKKLMKVYYCAPKPSDVDGFLGASPFRTTSEPSVTRWAKAAEAVQTGVKKLVDIWSACYCAPGPLDVDGFIEALPIPTKSEPTASLWEKVE